MLAEYDENGSLTTLYIRGEELISQERSDEKYYYLYDGFDSIRILIDSDSNIADTKNSGISGNQTIDTRHRE